MTHRWTGALLVCTLALAGCGEDVPSAAPSPTATASQAPSPSASPSASPTPAVPTGIDQEVVISYRAGKVSGPARVRVRKGDTVRLRVVSDVADHVHLHGYDKLVDVTPGKEAVLDFTATSTGVFVVELEEAERTLVRLQIQ